MKVYISKWLYYKWNNKCSGIQILVIATVYEIELEETKKRIERVKFFSEIEIYIRSG